MLPKFGEGSSEAADLVVEVRLGRYDAVASLQLECNCHLHPSGIPMHLAVPYAALIGNVRPSLRVDPVRQRMPNRAWDGLLFALDSTIGIDRGAEFGLVDGWSV